MEVGVADVLFVGHARVGVVPGGPMVMMASRNDEEPEGTRVEEALRLKTR